MTIIKRCLLVLFVLLSQLPTAHANVHEYFRSIQTNPDALYTFFKAMPKGGELHYHLAGGASAETMLALVANHNYCLNRRTAIIEKSGKHCDGIPSRTLLNQPDLYNQTIEAWSMERFIPDQQSAHDHFFDAFYKFISVVSNFRPQLLAEIMKHAADQHEHYLEIMILPDDAHSAGFGQLIETTTSLEKKQGILLSNQPFQNNIEFTIEESARILQQARRQLQCEKVNPQEPACQITVKFQYYLLREQPLDHFFAQGLNGFAAASLSPDLVGINLVQAEDDPIALRDYRKQMQIINFLHRAYPSVHIALHAGELTSNLVPPEALNFHIHDAVFVGQAERIGHGVSIKHENERSKLLTYMAQKPVPIEINLSSNETILSISHQQHPLRYYLAHQVPVVLSTDDEGILRTDLTQQYVIAAHRHQLDYSTLKTLNRNTLTYNFLPGPSLWSDPNQGIPVKACSDFNQLACQKFLSSSPKATLQWQLEKALAVFEQQFEFQPAASKNRNLCL